MAAETEQEQPIIVVKKKSGHGGHHGGAWKVAYADFVTALMAFFLVMWLVTQSDTIRENVEGYFNDPGGWGKNKGGDSILKGEKSILKGAGNKYINQPMSEARAKEVLKNAGERIRDALSYMPDFESIKDHIEIEMTEEGLRIELIESLDAEDKSAYFYSLGGSELSQKGVAILTAIANEISALNNKVVIEGHTDSRQFVYKDKYSNWELSADRANSARKLMENTGLKKNQVDEIRGYAANRPKIQDNPMDARNRRISIIVLNDKFAAEAGSVEFHEVINGRVVKDID